MNILYKIFTGIMITTVITCKYADIGNSGRNQRAVKINTIQGLLKLFV